MNDELNDDTPLFGEIGETQDRLIGIKAASHMLGVCPDTLRIWDAQGKLPAIRTPNGHRRWRVSDIRVVMNEGFKNASI